MTQQQDLTNSFMGAMETVVNNAVGRLKFDQTISCEVISVTNPAEGEYRVRYLNDSFLVYDSSHEGEVRYKPGQEVYVLIPKNDFSARKTITGKKTSSDTELNSPLRDIDKVSTSGIPILDIYGAELAGAIGVYAPISGALAGTGYRHVIYDAGSQGQTEHENLLFQSYARDKTRLLVTAKFKTSWLTRGYWPTAGDYGIKVIFSTVSEDKEVKLNLGTQGIFYGDPYNYTDYVQVYGLFDLKNEDNSLKALKSVELYAEPGFERYYDSATVIDQTGAQISLNKFLQLMADNGKFEIYVEDLTIQFVDEKDLSGYSLQIATPNGIYFKDSTGTALQEYIVLNAVLRYDGNTDAIEQKDVKYAWFERDTRINTVNADYAYTLGVGWKQLGETSNKLAINKKAFEDKGILHKEYACVAVYKGTETVYETVDVYNSVSDIGRYSLKLTKDATGRVGALECLDTASDAQPQSPLTAHWVSIDINHALRDYNDTDFLLENIDIANIYLRDTFYCSIISNNEVIYTVSFDVLDTVETKVFDIVWYVSNNGLFQYNEAGDCVGSEAKTASFEVVPNGQQEAFDYEYIWSFSPIAADNRLFEVSEDARLTGTQADNNQISFTISNRYHRNASENNQLELTINAEGGPYKFSYPLQFLKTGDPGTNGTSTTMSVQITGENKAILRNASSTVELDMQIYHNGYSSYNGKNVNYYYDFEFSVPKNYANNPITSPKTVLDGTSTFANGHKMITLNIITKNFDIVTNSNTIIQIRAIPNTADFKHELIYLLSLPCAVNTEMQTWEYIGPTRVMFNELGQNGEFDEIVPMINGENIGSVKGVLTRNADSGQLVVPNAFDPTTDTMIIVSQNEGYTVPVVGMLNAFSVDILNSWDGAGVIINEANNQYLLYPTIGAGTINSQNKFSGVLMGDLRNQSGSEHGLGLTGFNNGEGAFGFYQDGYAFIGHGVQGKIEFNADGQNATIQSGNYIKDNQGMKIDLNKGSIDAYDFKLTSSAILLDSPKQKFEFKLTDPNNTSSHFKIYGLNSSGSQIELLDISNNRYILQSANYSYDGRDAYNNATNFSDSGTRIDLKTGEIRTRGFYVSPSGSAEFSGSITGSRITGSSFGTEGGGFYVSNSGYMSCTNASINGSIDATYLTCYDGDIGGWSINRSGIYKGSNAIWSSGQASLANGNFGVDSAGNVACKSVYIGGDATISTSGGVVTVETAGLEIYQKGGLHMDASTNLALSAGQQLHLYSYGVDCISYTDGQLRFNDSFNNQTTLSDLRIARFG